MLKNVKEKYLEKGNYTKIKVILSIIISIIASCIVVFTRNHIIIDRIPIFAVIIEFILLHFIFKVKDIYEFIYKKRYYLAIIFMIYVVVMGYSGSSVGTYAEIVQAEYQEKYYTPILGKYRTIRSDEWCVNTPIYTSQAIDKDTPYAYYNDNLRGTTTDMSSIGNAPTLDLSIIGKPFNIGYFIFGAERGLSFVWYGKLAALLLVSFEFCMLITNKKKLVSLCGMLMITFSAAVQWWNSPEVLVWGMLVILLVDKFMLAKNMKIKLLCALGVFISGLSYIFIFYPAWQVSYGFVYLALFIWVCIKNRKQYKINWKDILIVLLVLLAIGAMVGRYFIKSQEALSLVMNTDYPGERFEIGGDKNAIKIVFSYVYSYLFPYVTTNNPCEASGMISFYPLPMIIAILYLIRNRKNKEDWKFIIPVLVIAVLLSIWIFIETNELFAKLTFLYMVPPIRAAVPLGFTQILLLVYMLAHLKETDIVIKSKELKTILAVILSVIIVWIANKTDVEMVMKNMRLYICSLITLFGIYQIFNINIDKNKKYLIGFLAIMAIITGTTVNPIQKGIGALTDKPIAKKVQEIVKEDKDSLWVVENTTFYIPNYILGNGARVINSTNIYPNFELYETVLGKEEAQKEEIRKIYNRYAHLNVEICKENKIELVYQDSTKLYITTEKLKELGVKYIVTTRPLEEFDTNDINYEEIYQEYGLAIYELKY